MGQGQYGYPFVVDSIDNTCQLRCHGEAVHNQYGVGGSAETGC